VAEWTLHGVPFAIQEPAMSIAAPQPARRIAVGTGHTYAIPVVRELPRPAAALDAGW